MKEYAIHNNSSYITKNIEEKSVCLDWRGANRGRYGCCMGGTFPQCPPCSNSIIEDCGGWVKADGDLSFLDHRRKR
jgi:predicted metal-binding protein